MSNSISIRNGDEDPSSRPKKRTRANALVRSASALLLCWGAVAIYGDVTGITSSSSGAGGNSRVTRAAATRIGERKNDYRRLVDSHFSPSYDSLHSTAGDKTAPMNHSMMPKPSVSDVIIMQDGTVTTYDLWLPKDNAGLLHEPSSPQPLVVMRTKPNNWMFGHDMRCCDTIQSYLDRGTAVASVVISTSTDLDGHQSMAIDLMKAKAEEYGIHPDRITLHVDNASANLSRRALGQGHDKKLENIVERTMMHWAAVPPTYENVPYIGKGSGGERTMDFWKAKSVDKNDTGRRPVVLYVHGGGWLADDKTMLDGHTFVSSFLDKGISFASINNRKTTDAANQLPIPVHDAARAVRFLKSLSKEWNIDRDRVALAGFSAGACTIMWITFTQDLANPDAEDPIDRESTRVAAAAVLSGQAFIDPKEIMQQIGPGAAKHPMLYSAVGEPNYESMMSHYDQHLPIFRQFSPLHHIERGGWGDLGPPPLYMVYGPMTPLPSTDPNLAIHHPKFGVLLKDHCDRVDNAECHLWIPGYPGYGAPPKRYPSAADFLYDKLGVISIGSSTNHEEV